MNPTLNSLDQRVVAWMSKHGIRLLRWSLGIVFLWFGFLKFFPGLSPAEELASKTLVALSFDLISLSIAPRLVAGLEVLIGLGLLTGRFPRFILFVLFVQMIGTFAPLILFPSETFKDFPFVPSFEGHYIIKNLVLVSAAIVIGATVRGSAVRPDPGLHR